MPQRPEEKIAELQHTLETRTRYMRLWEHRATENYAKLKRIREMLDD